MPDFFDLFLTSEGRSTTYKGRTIYLTDQFPVKNQDVLVVSVERVDSDYRQGFCIDVTGHCEVNGKLFKEGKGIRLLFWDDTVFKDMRIKIFTKKEFVKVYNIWEQKNQYLVDGAEKTSCSIESRHNGSAMLIEEIENGRRYRCNDGYPDEDFDDIIFTVQRIPQ